MINNRLTLKALRRVKKEKLMEKVHCFDKVLPKAENKNITKPNDTILECALMVTDKVSRAKLNGSQRANQQPG